MGTKCFQNEIVIFFGLLILLTAIVLVWLFRLRARGKAPVAMLMWVPAIATILTLAIRGIPFAELGWTVGKISDWGLALAFPILVALIAYGSMWLSRVTEFYRGELTNSWWARKIGFETPAGFCVAVTAKSIIALAISLPFVLGEEIGWSGFLVPRLAKTFSITQTSIIVGVCWSIWHFPLIIGRMYGTEAPLWVVLPGFTMALTGLSFFRTILVSESGSLWPGVIIHASHNSFVMGIFYEMTKKTRYSSWIVSESGLFLGAVYLACGLLYYYL